MHIHIYITCLLLSTVQSHI